MPIVVNMATFQARSSIICESLASLSKQVDKINLVLNEYTRIPIFLNRFPNVNPIMPPEDLKDAGKFFAEFDKDDDVFLCDDDIVYPPNYVETMQAAYAHFADLNPILGLHGVTYSDFFPGLPQARLVYSFYHEQPGHRLVNQVGTGTVHCKGWQLPNYEFMRTSQKFVDLRLAVHAFRQKFPMISVARSSGWLKEIRTEETIFSNFTQYWEPAITREAQEIAGFGKLNSTLLSRIEGRETMA